MNETIKICIEGLPRVGKSTIISQYKTEFNCIPEYFDYIDLDNFSDKIENLDDLICNQKKFIDIETIRKKGIKDQITIIDRCILSNLAFSYAMSKAKKNDDYFTESIKLHYDLMLESGLILPTHYIFFESKDEEDIKNKLSKIKEGLITNWSQELFLDKIREFYKMYFEKYCTVPNISVGPFPDKKEIDLIVKDFLQEDQIKGDEGIKKLMEDCL